MRLLMTLVVRDEEELLAANLDYHLAQGVDFVLVTDHGSSDATPEILDAYERRGVLRAFRETGEALDQGAWVTRMARLAASEHEADWVLNNDADEFWWPLAGTLKDMLAAVPPRYGQLTVARHNFVPRPGEGRFWERMTIREVASRNLLGDELEPNVVHRASPDVRVAHGNHWVRSGTLNASPRLPLIEVLHFPVRSYEQFERKVRQQGRGYGALAPRPPEVGRDQLTLHEVYRAGLLREWFDEAALEEERVEAALTRGELVEDRRLERFMAHLTAEGAPPRPSPADRLAVANLAAAAFAVSERAEAVEGRVEEARRRQAAADQRLAEVHRDLADAVIALEALRNSRLFRWTRGARRMFYALRGSQ